MTPALAWAARTVGLEVEEGGLRDVRDLSRLREGEDARREAREWCEGAGGVVG